MVRTLDNITSAKPLKVSKRRSIHQWRRSCTTPANGEIVGSDQAFIDVILEDCSLPSGSEWSRVITLESTRSCDQLLMDGKCMSVNYRHKLLYKMECIFIMESTSFCDPRGTWGQSSSCHLSKGHLKISINNKGMKAEGDGWNARETRVYCLDQLVKQSAKLRQNELEYISTS